MISFLSSFSILKEFKLAEIYDHVFNCFKVDTWQYLFSLASQNIFFSVAFENLFSGELCHY